MIPSLEYTRLGHKEIKAYGATATLTQTDSLNTYEISYPELERTLRIHYEATFPYAITGWEEIVKSGFGANAKLLTTAAKKMRVLKTAYWQHNGNKDVILRDSLGL
jgi:hypothetical protein